jgi:SagB-type dehydrogenase family enzyme
MDARAPLSYPEEPGQVPPEARSPFRRTAMKRWAALAASLLPALILLPLPALGQELAPIQLPAPQIQGGKPLMEALRDRQSVRSFRTDDLPLQTLSNLLWAGFGVNRPESGRRTAPSAVNWQEVDIYLTTREGAYRYNAQANRLEPVRAGDLRALTGTVAFVATAPLNLVYVADLAKITRESAEEKTFYSAIDTGFIAQNVYLYCASEGLAAVVRAQMDRDALAEALGLRADQKIIVAQTVGYPGG